MPYINMDYYNNTFHGEPVDSADFPSLCLRAEEIVEEISMYRITPVTILVMPEALQERIKMAVCAQVEYLDANGGGDFDNGTDLQSAGLGKFSYSVAGGANGRAGHPIYSPRALRLLMPTGFLYRGGGC